MTVVTDSTVRGNQTVHSYARGDVRCILPSYASLTGRTRGPDVLRPHDAYLAAVKDDYDDGGGTWRWESVCVCLCQTIFRRKRGQYLRACPGRRERKDEGGSGKLPGVDSDPERWWRSRENYVAPPQREREWETKGCRRKMKKKRKGVASRTMARFLLTPSPRSPYMCLIGLSKEGRKSVWFSSQHLSCVTHSFRTSNQLPFPRLTSPTPLSQNHGPASFGDEKTLAWVTNLISGDHPSYSVLCSKVLVTCRARGPSITSVTVLLWPLMPKKK